jgi:ATP-dependent Clp protease ATP-binding subunit ClpB
MRLDQFTVKAQEAIASAQTSAERQNHAEVTPEHLLLALLEQESGVVGSILARMGADAQAVRAEMDRVLGTLSHVARPPSSRASSTRSSRPRCAKRRR